MENFILFRFVQAYLIVSAIALLTTIEFAALIEADNNKDGIYCDYGAAGQPGLDWPMGTKPCQLRVGVFSFRLIFPVLVFLAAAQSPAYLFLIVRYVLRRWRGALPGI